MKISIITPSYNQGKYIEETIKSVNIQNYKDIEHIVVDGKSSDNTIEILERYEKNIKYVSEKDTGQANAVNKGIKMASGDIIGWLNSDDLYMPNTISKVMEYFKKNPKCDILYANAHFVDVNGTIIGKYPTERFDYKRLADRCYICQPSVFFRKKAIEDIGYLDESLHLCLDYELWMRIGKKYRFYYIDDYLSCSRMYQENKTLSRSDEMYEEAHSILKKYYGYVPLSWVKAKIFNDNPSYNNTKIIYESLKCFIKNNYCRPDIIINDFVKALILQIQGKVRWR
ncbi:glycosyltransferase family 2 protein [Clostridium magnum]|uniref:Chondroitin synthase n=1 Tax=Clostridium magnum DSM 2767 TaxID=1121326 RepID=A0A161X7S2_9CLOT|nr:glycosyltransferase family 2 protein [Clostridium magnum]KZL90196.1 chondroitin synthase [Clostridium magnum DSM 2767]SHH64134.1 Glycosyl transferase family 2 [Clostridium magnum DSM 2767]